PVIRSTSQSRIRCWSPISITITGERRVRSPAALTSHERSSLRSASSPFSSRTSSLPVSAICQTPSPLKRSALTAVGLSGRSASLGGEWVGPWRDSVSGRVDRADAHPTLHDTRGVDGQRLLLTVHAAWSGHVLGEVRLCGPISVGGRT